MKFLFYSACLCLALAGIKAQAPEPCVSPPLMEGMFQMSLNGEIYTAGQGRFSYDAFDSKMRVRMGGVYNGSASAMDHLFLFNKGVYYTIDYTKFKCTKGKLDSRFNPIKVPPQSALLGQTVMGTSSAPGMGMLINTWAGVIGSDTPYMSVFTGIGCIPVMHASCTPGEAHVFFNIFNVMLGISDPMDFIPPFFCPKSAELDEAAEPQSIFNILQTQPGDQ